MFLEIDPPVDSEFGSKSRIKVFLVLHYLSTSVSGAVITMLANAGSHSLSMMQCFIIIVTFLFMMSPVKRHDLRLTCYSPEADLRLAWDCPETDLRLTWDWPETDLRLTWGWPETDLGLTQSALRCRLRALEHLSPDTNKQRLARSQKCAVQAELLYMRQWNVENHQNPTYLINFYRI